MMRVRLHKKLTTSLMVAMATVVIASCSDGDADGHGGDTPAPTPTPTVKPPNILFVIMDDVGIDQMTSFGYGGVTAPPVPNIDAVAAAGVKFRNTWSMPECSPGRAAFFAGRYPLRTNMHQALGPNDLANSQISPHDQTVPKVLKEAGYESAMFGKFHLAGPENNEAGNATPAVLGWDYFYGWVGGLPGSVDTTAGGVYADGTKSCGFHAERVAGACHHADGSCEDMPQATSEQDANGLQCLTKGGIFVESHTCGDPLPAGVTLNFDKENAFYVSPLVIVQNGQAEAIPLTDGRSRGYRTTIETDAAIQWIKSRSAEKPWMATVSYSAAHTPWQQAPRDLAPQSRASVSDKTLDCTNTAAGRAIQNQMTEAMDTEFGRLLIETGLATRGQDGSLVYDPKASNTVVVIVGDNGSLGFAVKQPFSPTLAKGTSYQTGVWVPLIVAGSQVDSPGREVHHMVNGVDLFQFFGELASIDVHKSVPRRLDSVGLLPYLTNPDQGSLRTINFAQSGVNIQANGARNGPCVINRTSTSGGSCTQIPTMKSVCEDNGGVWWGPGYTAPSVVPNGGAGYALCWQVNQAILAADASALPVDVTPEETMAIRNERYKLVKNTIVNYDAETNASRQDVSVELYEIDQATPRPLLDDPDKNLLAATLSAEAQAAYDELSAKLDALFASEPVCPGDGNKDGVVDDDDLSNWRTIADGWGLSSDYDFSHDGRTDETDEQVIQANMGKVCSAGDGVY